MAAKLAHLQPDQIEQLIKRARQLRARSNDHEATLDAWVERVMRKDQRDRSESTSQQQGIVVGITANTCAVETAPHAPPQTVSTHLMTPVVGDQVTIGQGRGSDWAVVEIAPRRTKLSRPEVQTASWDQVIVANVDVVVIVVSVVTPPLHHKLIDRYLVAIHQGGAQPLICVNKIDLLTDFGELSVLDAYTEIGIEVVRCSTQEESGLDSLRAAVSGKTCAFVGHSGVGKSSIVNRLKPGANLLVGAISEGYGRGTHTTRASSLHHLGDGTVLIDTPGIRVFGLSDLTKSEVSGYFPEFARLQCRFRNCRHDGEPGCAVLEAVESGAVDRSRFESYRRLMKQASPS